jgi:large subunit ribosomal protein L10
MRPEKASIVADLSQKLSRSPFVLVTDYQRMNVNHFADLRNRLAATGAEVHVVKNSFLRRAMTDSGLPDLADQLTGQTAVVTGDKDVAPVAKIFKSFLAEFKIAALKIGVVDKSILSTEELETLAELPAREVLLAQLLGLFMSPATKLVRVLNEPGSAFARLLNAKASKMPAVEPPKAPEPAPSMEPQAAAIDAPKEEASKAEAPGEEPAKPEASKADAPVEAAPATESAPMTEPSPAAEPGQAEPQTPEDAT